MDAYKVGLRKVSGLLVVTSVLAFVIFIILLAYHYYVSPIFSFLSLNKKNIDAVPDVTQETRYGTSPAPNDTAIPFNHLITNKFTLSFDCFLDGTYRATDVPRVLFYFDIAAYTGGNVNTLNEYTGDTVEVPRIINYSETTLDTQFPMTNFIIYLDPVKNDLKVGIFTKNTAATINNIELLPTVKNVPINAPFKITLMLSDSYAELYKNNLIESTYKIIDPIDNSRVALVTGTPPCKLFSPIGILANSVKVGNIQFFNNTLTSSQVRTLNNPIKDAQFFKQSN